MNVDEALKVIGDYADSLLTADDIADRDSGVSAAAADELYESKVWVAEWLEQRPVSKKRTGRPVDPESRNRFAQWLAWRLEQQGRNSIHGVHTYRLLDAATIAKTIDPSYLTQGKITRERTVRPLKWFLRYYADRIPDVWAVAVEFAGGDPALVTSAHVKDAVKHYKGEVITPKGVQQLVKVGKATRLRIRIKSEFTEMVALAQADDDAKKELKRLAAELEAILDGAQ